MNLDTMSEREIVEALKQARLRDEEQERQRALQAHFSARDAREAFHSRHAHSGMEQLGDEILYGDGARVFANGGTAEPPTDQRQLLGHRRIFLKIRLKKWEAQYDDQCKYVRDALAIMRMGAGPGPGGDWKTELPKFGQLIEDLYRELNEIQAQLFPQGQGPTSRALVRQQAADDTEFLSALPQFQSK